MNSTVGEREEVTILKEIVSIFSVPCPSHTSCYVVINIPAANHSQPHTQNTDLLWQFLCLSSLGLQSSDVALPVSHTRAVSLHQSLNVHTAKNHPPTELLQSQLETLKQPLRLEKRNNKEVISVNLHKVDHQTVVSIELLDHHRIHNRTYNDGYTFLYTVDSPAAFLRIIPGNMVWAGDAASVTPRKCNGMDMNLHNTWKWREREGERE